MSVLERPPGNFRPIFHVRFQPMPPLKNVKDPFHRLWCHMAPPLASTGRSKSKGTVLFFRVYIFPVFQTWNYMLHSRLSKASKNPTLSDPLWVPGTLFCHPWGWEYWSTKGPSGSKPPSGSWARIRGQIYSFSILKTFSLDAIGVHQHQTKWHFLCLLLLCPRT